jgi:hypothetical protein
VSALVPAAGEPDEPNRGDSGDATASRPADAIWKSVIGATGSFGCERETFYRETVRDEQGWRLRFPATADIVFGVAIDSLHERLTMLHMTAGPTDEDGLREWLQDAATRAVGVARGRDLVRPLTDDEWLAFAESVLLAGEKLLGLWPNRVKANGDRIPDPEGAGPPVTWLDPEPGTVLRSQHRMSAPGVVGGRGISGRPDYAVMSAADGSIVGWADVKALSRAGSYPAKWTAGEAVAYDYMSTYENGGVVPDWHAYIEYRRVAKPYWAMERAPVLPASVRLAEAYFTRWERALDGDDPDALSFNPKACARCEYREPIEGLHPGCPIGGASLDISPAPDESDS